MALWPRLCTAVPGPGPTDLPAALNARVGPARPPASGQQAHHIASQEPVRTPDLVTRTSPGFSQRLVGDITYLHTAEGGLHLVTVIDLVTRMVAGRHPAGRTSFPPSACS